MMGLGDLSGGILGSEATGISHDGSVIAGSGVSSNGIEAFRWTLEGGMVGLGDLPGGGFFSEAYDVSADGSVIVGESVANSGLFPRRGFRWSADDGMTVLPDVPGVGPTFSAESVSADGKVIVGSAYSGNSVAAFAWDPFHGSRGIAELLTSQGVELNGFDLRTARGVSADGLTIAGLGVPADRATFQPWVARLDAGTFVPEPGALGLGAISAALLCLLFRRWTECRVQR
jgi:probable HAF family extracellular repeat protein